MNNEINKFLEDLTLVLGELTTSEKVLALMAYSLARGETEIVPDKQKKIPFIIQNAMRYPEDKPMKEDCIQCGVTYLTEEVPVDCPHVRTCPSCLEEIGPTGSADPLEITYVWNCNCGYQGNRSVLEGTEVHGDDFFRGTCAGCGKKKDVIVPKFDVNDV